MRGILGVVGVRRPAGGLVDHLCRRQPRRRRIILVNIDGFRKPVGLLLAALLFTSCGAGDGVPVIDLSERVSSTTPDLVAQESLRVAVAAILSPAGNLDSYGAFAEYLSQRLDRPVELIQRRTYAEVNDLLETGEADIAFVCTSAYVRGHDEFGLRLLVAPEIDGSLVYYSDLIVSADDEATSMADLRGAVFAFTDPMSTTGRLYPTHLVRALGLEPETFFSNTFFTYSHDAAITAVATDVVAAAGVDSLVLAYVLREQPDLPIKVIDRSPAFAIPPVVASPRLPTEEADEIRDLLLGMSIDPAAANVLVAMGVDRFVTIEDDAYRGVRELLAQFEDV